MKPIYFIDIIAQSCSFICKLNGFPALIFNAEFLSNPAQSVNQFLIGKNNRLDILIAPINASEDINQQDDAISKIKLSGTIKIYQPGDVSRPDGGSVVNEFSFDGQLAGSVSFDNDFHDFSSLLIGNEIKVSDQELKTYGLKLFKMFQDQDVDNLANEFQHKMFDYAKAYFQEENSFFKGFQDFIKNDFFKFPNDKTLITIDHILIKSWCNKRIFEIGITPNEPLLTSYAEEDESMVYEIVVFVALLNGELKVVR